MRFITLILTMSACIFSTAILTGCVCAEDDVYYGHVSHGYPVYGGYAGGYSCPDYCGPRGYYRERSCEHAHVIPRDDCYSGHCSRRHGGYGPKGHAIDGYSGDTSSSYQGGTSSTYQGNTYSSGPSSSYQGGSANSE